MVNFPFSPLPPIPEILLTEVDIRAELGRRTPRQPDYGAENQALIQLAEELSANPQNVLQKLAEIAMQLCRAGSAGVNLLENHHGQLVFRWAALAGAYVMHREGTMSRNASPCGVTIDRNTTQLMYLPERVCLGFTRLSLFPFILMEHRSEPSGSSPMTRNASSIVKMSES